MPASHDQSLKRFVCDQNARKQLFTAGPASLLVENLTSLQPCFGRGDTDYEETEARVMQSLQRMTGHERLIRLQGSATLAIEIALRNFVTGTVLVVNSGYYADRMLSMAESIASDSGGRIRVHSITSDQIDKVDGHADWVLSCYTETSVGMKLPIDDLRKLADRLGAKLLLDATASIGLEDRHELADVVAYSSCKGLFGLTGGAFVASHHAPTVEVRSFYLNYHTHSERRVTGPYHALLSLADVLPRHDEFRHAVVVNKRRCLDLFRNDVTWPAALQPLLCTRLNKRVSARSAQAILYTPRLLDQTGSVICHLGEVHLSTGARGEILDQLEVQA